MAVAAAEGVSAGAAAEAAAFAAVVDRDAAVAAIAQFATPAVHASAPEVVPLYPVIQAETFARFGKAGDQASVASQIALKVQGD